MNATTRTVPGSVLSMGRPRVTGEQGPLGQTFGLLGGDTYFTRARLK
jgi:hypothetical protein